MIETEKKVLPVLDVSEVSILVLYCGEEVRGTGGAAAEVPGGAAALGPVLGVIVTRTHLAVIHGY